MRCKMCVWVRFQLSSCTKKELCHTKRPIELDRTKPFYYSLLLLIRLWGEYICVCACVCGHDNFALFHICCPNKKLTSNSNHNCNHKIILCAENDVRYGVYSQWGDIPIEYQSNRLTQFNFHLFEPIFACTRKGADRRTVAEKRRSW